MSAGAIPETNASSSTDPWSTVQFGGLPANSRIISVVFTEKGSTSKLTTRAEPARIAASEWMPLPQPTSRKVLPDRFFASRNASMWSLDILTRSSLKLRSANSCQLGIGNSFFSPVGGGRGNRPFRPSFIRVKALHSDLSRDMIRAPGQTAS